MEALSLYVPDMPWQSTSDFPSEADEKVLRDEDARQARTVLVRLRAGGHVRPHGHPGTVQHYILEGDYESKGVTYRTGSYRVFPEHADVPEFSTQHGVTILIIYDPVA